MELGAFTFAEMIPDESGSVISEHERMRQVVAEGSLADEVGLDVYAIGEHHRSDFIVSSPATVLAAVAEHTEHVRLSSAVTVLSSDDPVRVFQDYATLDLLSGGRAEIMAGRGSFTESFPLFGYDLADYHELFADKLEMLLAITRSPGKVTWPGTRHTQSLDGVGIHPWPVQDPLPVWIAVGGTPESVMRAGALGIPLAVAIIGGEPERFVPLVELYRQALDKAGHGRSSQGVAISQHGYIAESSEQARDELWPSYSVMMNRIARERGFAPITRAVYEQMCEPDGHLLVGSPDDVADKLMREYDMFSNTRFLVQFNATATGHAGIMRSIELFGREVAPRVREHVERAASIGAD